MTQGRRLSLADIAARTGLSTATVSRAMNGKPRVAESTRERVLAALAEAEYVPSGIARSLRTGRTGLLGIIIDTPADPIRLATMQGALDAAVPAGYSVVVHMALQSEGQTGAFAAVIGPGWVDGALLLWPSRADAPFAQRLRQSGVPLVLIEPEVDMGLPAVYADAYSDGYQSTRCLLELGHRRIAACPNPPGWGIEGRYLDGYLAALAEAGLPPDSALCTAAGWSYEVGYDAAAGWLTLPDPPTAMCFRCDMAAMGAVAAARERGRAVPGDVSVIGGDDTQMASWTRPALTVPRQRRSGLARAASELLLSLIDGTRPPATPLLLATDLEVRQSTGPPPPARG